MAKKGIKKAIEEDGDVLDVAVDRATEIYKTLTENEKTFIHMFAPIVDQTAFPIEFFKERNTEELNNFFGAHDDVVLTDAVRAYFYYYNIIDKYFKNLYGIYNIHDLNKG